MPGFLIQQGATVMCAHGGQAMPTVPNPRVTLDGMPATTTTDPWTVAGCPGVPPPVPPCVTAQWILGTTRVTSMGQPLVVQSGGRDHSAGRGAADAGRDAEEGHRDMSTRSPSPTASTPAAIPLRPTRSRTSAT